MSGVSRRPPHLTSEDALANAEWVRRLSAALMRDPVEAADLGQDAWLAASADRSRTGSLGAWLTGVLRNLARKRARDGGRRARREVELGDGLVDEGARPDAIVERLELHQHVARLLLGLDEPLREVVFLHYYEGLTSAAIGERLGIAAGTVRWRLKQGLDALRERLDVDFGDRRRWTVLLAPTALRLVRGAVIMKKAWLVLGALLLLTFLGLVARTVGRRGGSDAHDDRGGAVPQTRAALRLSAVPRTTVALPGWFGVAALPERRIAGRVVSGGRGVAGAHVVLGSLASRAGLLAPEEQLTGRDGQFAFTARRAAVYEVTASAEGQGFGVARVDTQDPEADPSSEAVIVRLSGCGHALVGRVTDASSGPIQGAEVLLAAGKAYGVTPFGLGTHTGPDGDFRLCAPPGPLTAIVRASGYGSVTLVDRLFGELRRDVALLPEATVIGRVVRAGSGEPVEGAAIWLYPGAWPERMQTTIASATSDSDGRFRLSGVSPGRHQLFASTPERWATRWATVVVEAGQTSREVDLIAGPPALTLRGVVTEDGRPVPGARVRARSNGRGVAALPADLAGRFELDLERPGDVWIDGVEGHELLQPDRPVDPTSGELRVEVASRGRVRGRVLHRGLPVADVVVTASGPGQASVARATTDEGGVFDLRGLPSGRVVLAAWSENLQASTRETTPLDLAAREQRTDVLLQLSADAQVSGRVVDQEARPLAGAVVEYRRVDGQDSCRATADDRGAFTCGMLGGEGVYVPSVFHDAASNQPLPAAGEQSLAPVELRDGEARGHARLLRVVVLRHAIEGYVLDGAGAPIPDVTVRAIEASQGYAPETAAWLGLRTTLTDSAGAFRIEVGGGSQYILQARAPGGGEAILPGVLAGTRAVVLRLTTPGRVDGVLQGFARSPELFLRPIGNTVDFIWPSVVGDTFFAEGLAPGRYALTAVAGAQGASDTIEIRAGEQTRVTLRARTTTRLRSVVRDFVTGAPVVGATCFVYPYVPGGGIAFWGQPMPPTDERGEVVVDAPVGLLEVTCSGRAYRHGMGAARRLIEGRAADVSILNVPVVASARAGSAEVLNGIGARFVFGFDEPRHGYVHGIAELRAGGSADQAGLRIGDVVVAVDRRETLVLADLELLLGSDDVGQSVLLTIQRGARRFDVAVSVEAAWR
jgi:RNA polymerase sigma factor (sigma-70 family)